MTAADLKLVADHPDKRLFVLLQAMQLELGSLDAYSHGHGNDDSDAGTDCTRLWAIRDEVLALPAQTIAGLAVKIRVAKVSLLALAAEAGVEAPEKCPPIDVLDAVLADAERLAHNMGRAVRRIPIIGFIGSDDERVHLYGPEAE